MSTQGPDAEGIRTLADQSREALGELRKNLSEADAERRTRLDDLSGQADNLVEQLTSQIAGELSEDLSAQYGEQAELSRQQLEAEREAWLREKTEWESVRQQIEVELGEREEKLETDLAALKERADSETAGADGVLLEKLEHALAQQEASEQQFASLHAHVGELTTALETANQRLATAGENETELESLRSKFDLVMADLQSHREHIAELEEQLAARPEANPADNAELTQLREERTELTRQLEDLSAQAPAGEPSAEIEDLRTRFEMAVEDVRELKNENNELREQLASTTCVVPTADGNDWEAQKRRLLASLEEEGDSDDAGRQEERAKIEGTIQITDEVIAEKDREIERLLETIQTSIDQDATDLADEDRAANAAVLDADETIRAERERLARFEAEVQEKLRKAELELSVERAKTSRTQAELSEQQLELETLRATVGGAPVGESKRRWMDKLGLGNNGE